ncbi:hypothetical protein AB6D20_027695 (plasmid) [Vibrio splendidus]
MDENDKDRRKDRRRAQLERSSPPQRSYRHREAALCGRPMWSPKTKDYLERTPETRDNTLINLERTPETRDNTLIIAYTNQESRTPTRSETPSETPSPNTSVSA